MRSAARAGSTTFAILAVVLAACGETPPEPAPVPPGPAPVAPKPAAPADLVFDGVPFVAAGARWKVATWKPEPVVGPSGDSGVTRTVLRAVEATPEGGRPPLRLVVRMTPQFEIVGEQRREHWQEFRNWGKSVKIGNVRELATGHYEDWIREAVDVIKDFCRPPTVSKDGANLVYGGRAVGSDRVTRRREYRTWFVWSRDASVPETYVATFVGDAACPASEDLAARDAAALDLIQSIRPIRQSESK